MDMKTLHAMAEETAKPVAWEIWEVRLADGRYFLVSGQIAAEDWVKENGGSCCFTGRYEPPSIT